MSHEFKVGDCVKAHKTSYGLKEGEEAVITSVSDDGTYFRVKGLKAGDSANCFVLVTSEPDFKALADEYRHHRQKTFDISKTLQTAGFKLFYTEIESKPILPEYDAKNYKWRREIVTKEEL